MGEPGQIRRMVIVGLAVFAVCATPALGGEMRTWTSAGGAALEAEFVEQRLDQVVLRNTEGKMIQIQLNRLSREDQVYVGSLRSAAVPASAAPAEAAIPPAIQEIFGTRLVNAKGQRVSPAILDGKKIGIYFSAHWCPPCRAFTPQLVSVYNALKKEGKPFEIVFISSDRAEADMVRYMKEMDMPWPAVRFADKNREELKKKYGIQGIPTLVIIDSSGKTLSANARGDVANQGLAEFDKW
ncbi:MAG: redoxin family protein [Verrucomicrobia bacterium]|nr:redoxin family protein [Verrucomicrobiota bacterium]MBU1910383.1 redoxin family protein [Verrucomicrobiota bacterium]